MGYLIGKADSVKYYRVPKTRRLSTDGPLHIIAIFILIVCWQWGLWIAWDLEEPPWDSSRRLSGSEMEWINNARSSWCPVISSDIPSPRIRTREPEPGLGRGLCLPTQQTVTGDREQVAHVVRPANSCTRGMKRNWVQRGPSDGEDLMPRWSGRMLSRGSGLSWAFSREAAQKY